MMISAKVEAKDIQKAKDLGADDYIKKPIDINALLKKINTILGK